MDGMDGVRAARIDSLLDPDRIVTAAQRGAQRPLEWDRTETIGRKITRLSYHLGEQWATALAGRDDDLRHAITDAMALRHDGTGNEAGRVELIDAANPPAWAGRFLATGGYPSTRPAALVHMGTLGREQARAMGFRKPVAGQYAVLLATGVRHTTRSMFGAHADHAGSLNRDLTAAWTPPSDVWQWTRPRPGRPDFIGRGDMELLIGYKRVHDTIERMSGIDIADRERYTTTGEMTERNRLLHHCLDLIALSEDAQRLRATHTRETHAIAGAFDDKIPVSAAVAALAAHSPLNHVFGHVEFDEDIDQSKIGQMEQEILTAMRHLPDTGTPLSALRVRKLGRYRDNTLGLYSPTRHAIALDDGKATRNGYSGMSAFIHEYGHHIDETADPAGVPLSMGERFRPMLEAVTDSVDATQGLSASQRDYLKTPTEAFARCFEYWAGEILGVESSLLATYGEYQTETRYAAMRDNETLLDDTMRALIPDMHAFDTLDTSQWQKHHDQTATAKIEPHDATDGQSAPYDPYAGMDDIEDIDYTNATQPDIFDLLGMDLTATAGPVR